MKINNLIKVLCFIKELKGDIDLYDISEYLGKIYLDFKCDVKPYELTYFIEKTKDWSDESGKKLLMIINEVYLDENNDPITTRFCMDENGAIKY